MYTASALLFSVCVSITDWLKLVLLQIFLQLNDLSLFSTETIHRRGGRLTLTSRLFCFYARTMYVNCEWVNERIYAERKIENEKSRKKKQKGGTEERFVWTQ